MISLIGMFKILSSSVTISTVQFVRAFPRGTLAVCTRLMPFRLNLGCGLSFKMNTMSATKKNGHDI